MLLRVLLTGTALGVLASVMRAPGGFGWTEWPVAGPWNRALFSSVPWLVVAVVAQRTGLFASRVSALPLGLLGVALGLAAHGLWGGDWLPTTRLGFALSVLGATFVMAIASRTKDTDGAPPPPGWRAHVGFGLVGLGIAGTLDVLSRRAGLLTLGTHEEATLHGAIAVVGVALGARAFGAPLAAKFKGLAASLGWFAVPLTAIAALGFLDRMTLEGFSAHLGRFDYRPSEIGQFGPAILVAFTAWLLPAFGLGFALPATARFRGLSAVAFGTFLGRLLLPIVWASNTKVIDELEIPGDTGATWLVVASACTIGLGLSVVAFSLQLSKGRRTIAVLGSIAALVAVFAAGPSACWIMSPWYLSRITPHRIVEGPSGIATVEWSPGGGRHATLNRRRLTPFEADRQADDRMLLASLTLVPESAERILIVGQLDPGRSRVLDYFPRLRFERTAPWFDVLDPLEQALFADSDVPIAGEQVSPREAKRKLAEGGYDFVLCLPIDGPLLRPHGASVIPWGPPPAPVAGGLELSEDTRGVAWMQASSAGWRGGDEDATYLLGGGDLRTLRIGEYIGDAPTKRLLFQAAGASESPSPLTVLDTFALERADDQRHANLSRLADRSSDGSREFEIADALSEFYGKQVVSSPFESAADAVELDEVTLQRLFRATGKEGPTPFLRDTWTWLAWVVDQKRRADWGLTYFETLAETFGPWPALDRMVARSYHEFADGEGESRAYARALEIQANDVDLWKAAARAAERAGDFPLAAERYRAALELAPSGELERALGMALLRAGDLEGRALLEAWSEADPTDEAVRLALDEGVFPEVETQFEPSEGLDWYTEDHGPTKQQ